MAEGKRYDGFLPGRWLIDAYGAGGFRFGEMSHKGSLLFLPSGVKAWPVVDGEAWAGQQFAPVLAEHGEIELLLIGTGVNLRPLPEALRYRFKELRIAIEPMATPPPPARTISSSRRDGRSRRR